MKRIIVAGIGTGVGKTVVSAIVATALEADYWKPVQCGEEDSTIMKRMLDPFKHTIHPTAYTFKAPLSPHHAAALEKVYIDCNSIRPPSTRKSLVIEGVGGVLVPLTLKTYTLELFKTWNCSWIIVSHHYLGSINHTLLTLEVLKSHGIPIAGLIFNGEPNPASENVILNIGQVPLLTKLLPQSTLNKQNIQLIAEQWKPKLLKI